MKKLLICLCLLILGTCAVFIATASFESKPKVSVLTELSNSIFLGVDHLDNNIIGFASNIDLSEYSLHSNCHVQSKFIGNVAQQYFFYISYTGDCHNNTVVLEKGGVHLYSSVHKFKIYNEFDIYNKFLDYSTNDLKEVLYDISKKRKTLQAYSDIKLADVGDMPLLKKKRKYDEVLYIQTIIVSILEGREYLYLVPIAGAELSDEKTHMPNFSRGYRKDYTDGIHHGWDVFAPNESTVRAIDKGLIVHIVSNFHYSDLNNIARGNNLSDFQKIQNLNILRGNQVWLKTMKGEVVFYSHLTDIEPGLKVGDIVAKGASLGTTGITGIPEVGYSNFHLHFAIQENPYNILKAGRYSLDDYMSWNWLLKGLSMDEVEEKQTEIFVK